MNKKPLSEITNELKQYFIKEQLTGHEILMVVRDIETLALLAIFDSYLEVKNRSLSDEKS